jgi:hypothetical protein
MSSEGTAANGGVDTAVPGRERPVSPGAEATAEPGTIEDAATAEDTAGGGKVGGDIATAGDTAAGVEPDPRGNGDETRKLPEEPDTAPSKTGVVGSFLNGQAAAAIFFALAYWVTIYCLPDRAQPAAFPYLWVLFLVLAVFGLSLSFLAVGKGSIGRLYTVCLVAYVLLLDGLLFSAYYGVVTYGPSLKFTLAIGGVALMSFIVGIIVFDTLRVAASLPIVVLFIGIVADPAGFTAGADIRSQLVIWMGGVLGLSTVAEGLTQWTKIRGDASVKAAVATANPNAPAMAEETTKALAPANIGGDLSPSMGLPAATAGR